MRSRYGENRSIWSLIHGSTIIVLTIVLTILKYAGTTILAPLVVFIADTIVEFVALILLLFPPAEKDRGTPPSGRNAIVQVLGGMVGGATGIIVLMLTYEWLFGVPMWFLPVLCTISTLAVAHATAEDNPHLAYWPISVGMGTMAATCLYLTRFFAT